MDNLVDFSSPLVISAFAAVGLVILLLLIYRLRYLPRKKNQASFSETTTSTEISDAPSFLDNFQVDAKGARIEEARILANYGRFEKAISVLEEQIRDYPEEEAAYFELFLIYFHLEDEYACIKLLKSLPFEQSSSSFQNFLANAKMEFPHSQAIADFGKKDKQPVNDKASEKKLSKTSELTNDSKVQQTKVNKTAVPADKRSLAGQSIGSGRDNDPTHLTSPTPQENQHNGAQVQTQKMLQAKSENTAQPIRKNENVQGVRKVLEGQKIIRIEPETPIQNLSALEWLIFKSFSTQASVDQKYNQYLDNHEKTWQVLSSKNPQYQPLMSLHSEHEQQTGQVADPASLVYQQAKQLMAEKHFRQAEQLLEQSLLKNTDYEKLYPLLMQSYVQGAEAEAYYKFRDAIFAHEQQPSLETIYLLADAESKIIEKLDMVA